MAEGAPLLVITLKTTTLRRCATCEGPAPPDLPARVVVTSPVTPLRPLSGLLPLGFGREPGQEG
jgi:hypothetical protein